MALGDVVNKGEQPVVTFRLEAPDSRLDLDAAPVLSNEGRLVPERRLAAGQSRCQLVPELLALIGGGELDQGWERRELGGGVASQLLVGRVASDELSVLGDHQSLADVAYRMEER